MADRKIVARRWLAGVAVEGPMVFLACGVDQAGPMPIAAAVEMVSGLLFGAVQCEKVGPDARLDVCLVRGGLSPVRLSPAEVYDSCAGVLSLVAQLASERESALLLGEREDSLASTLGVPDQNMLDGPGDLDSVLSGNANGEGE